MAKQSDRDGTSTTGSYRLDIQALRGIAVVLVVAFHADDAVTGGFIGVDVFFVISGFVITTLLVRELRTTGRLALRDFYARRIRRLLPTLATVLLTSMAATIILLSPAGAQQKAATTAASAAAFGSNIYLYRFGVPYFDPENENPFIHTWSLSVEEQVYLVLPVLVGGLWWLGRRRGAATKGTLFGLAVLCLLSLLLCLATTRGWSVVPIPRRFAFYLPFSRLWEFGVGACLAVIAHRLPQHRYVGSVLGVLGLCAVAAAAVRFNSNLEFPGSAALLPVAGTAAMLAGGTMSSQWSHLLSRPTLIRLGDISYEWYLWHWPAIVLIAYNWPGSKWAIWAAAFLTIPLAIATKRWIGDRFRHDTRIAGRRALALTLLCVFVPVVAALAIQQGAERGWGIDTLRSVTDAQRRSKAEGAGCDSILLTSGCVFPGVTNESVILIGDSQASAISDEVWSAAAQRGATFGIWTRPGCPFLVGVPNSKPCAAWSEQVASWLATEQPTVLFVHLAALNYVTDSPAQTATGRSTTEFAQGIAGILELVRPWGTAVVFIGPIPIHETSEMNSANLMRPHPRPSSTSRERAEAESRGVMSALATLTDRSGLVLIDPVAAVCDATTCSQFRDGWIYRDGSHLSPDGARLLRPAIDAALLELLTATGP